MEHYDGVISGQFIGVYRTSQPIAGIDAVAVSATLSGSAPLPLARFTDPAFSEELRVYLKVPPLPSAPDAQHTHFQRGGGDTTLSVLNTEDRAYILTRFRKTFRLLFTSENPEHITKLQLVSTRVASISSSSPPIASRTRTSTTKSCSPSMVSATSRCRASASSSEVSLSQNASTNADRERTRHF